MSEAVNSQVDNFPDIETVFTNLVIFRETPWVTCWVQGLPVCSTDEHACFLEVACNSVFQEAIWENWCVCLNCLGDMLDPDSAFVSLDQNFVFLQNLVWPPNCCSLLGSQFSFCILSSVLLCWSMCISLSMFTKCLSRWHVGSGACMLVHELCHWSYLCSVNWCKYKIMEISSRICRCVPLHDSYSMSRLRYSGIIWPRFSQSMRWEKCRWFSDLYAGTEHPVKHLQKARFAQRPEIPIATILAFYTEAEQGLQQTGFWKSPLYPSRHTYVLWYSLPFNVAPSVNWRQLTPHDFSV